MKFLKEEFNIIQITKIILLILFGATIIRITLQLDKIIELL